jgi:hypothetical protein
MAKWSSMPEELKQMYYDLEAEDQHRYLEEIQEYKEKCTAHLAEIAEDGH